MTKVINFHKARRDLWVKQGWAWPEGLACSQSDLGTLRRIAVESMQQEGLLQEGEPASFTCDNCGEKAICKWVYDPYCTKGSCLAEK